MKNSTLFNKKNFCVLFIFVISLLINQYYGNKGVFPVDSFAHFDTGFRIFLGEYPFKNYWIVSGPIVDYIQAVFFYIFGVNWQSYVLHASLFNAILSLATFVIFRNFNLNLYYSLLYTLSFSILAYPVSATPFVDLHSAFFSLLGIYALILGIKNEKNIYWIFLPLFFTFAFLSKQVPSSYVIISVIVILSIYSLTHKKYKWMKYSFSSLILLIFFLLVFGKIQGIKLSSFLEQYLFYPLTIGSQRFSNYNFTFEGVILHFKFIYIALSPLLFINLRKIFFSNKYYKSNNFYYFLILILFTLSLILHQLLTRNQTFIFFLIPILFGFSHIYFNLNHSNFKKSTSVILILVCIFATIKYHIRFNENRKFHELNYVNFKSFSFAKEIDKKFLGLKWITPEYKNETQKEISHINQIKLHLDKDSRKKMLLTNYSFFSAILNEKLFSPTRWHIFDGTDYPLTGNKYFINYKNLLIKLIEENNIKVIYTTYPVESSILYKYLDKECLEEVKISNILNSYEIKNCYK